MFVKFAIVIVGFVVIALMVLAAVKAFKRADVSQKLEDIDTTAKLHDQIKDVDLEEAARQRDEVEKFKNS